MSTHAENVHLMNENSDLRKQVRELAAALRFLVDSVRSTNTLGALHNCNALLEARAALAKLDGKP